MITMNYIIRKAGGTRTKVSCKLKNFRTLNNYRIFIMRFACLSVSYVLVMIFAVAVYSAEPVRMIDYRFDSGKGITIKDWSAFHNNATVFGPEWANVIRWEKGSGVVIIGDGALIPGSSAITPEKFRLDLTIKPLAKANNRSSVFALYITPFYLKDRTLTWKDGYKKYYPLYYIFRVRLISAKKISVLLSLKDGSGRLIQKTFVFPVALPSDKLSELSISFDQKELQITLNGKNKKFPAKGKLYYDLPQFYKGHVNGCLAESSSCFYKKLEFYDLDIKDRPNPKYGLKITTPYYMNFFAQDEKKEINVGVENLYSTERSGKLYFEVSDFLGKEIYRKTSDIKLKPLQTNYEKIIIPSKLRGCFWIKCLFRDNNGESVQRGSQYSVGAIRSVKDIPDTSPFGRCDVGNAVWSKPQRVEDFGEKWIRLNIDWRQFEPKEGEFDFSILDNCINHFHDEGRKIYLCFNSISPAWMTPRKHKFMTPTLKNLKYYERMLRKILTRYKDKISGMDISNEANARHCFKNASPDFYVKIAEIAKKARDECVPEAFLGGPSACRGGWDLQTEQYLAKGAGKCWDRLDTHYLGGSAGFSLMPEEVVLQTIRGSRALLKKYSLALPIIDGETGYVVCGRRAIDGLPMSKIQLALAKKRKELYISPFTRFNKPIHYGMNSRDESTASQITVRRMILCLSEDVKLHVRHGVGSMTYNSENYPNYLHKLDAGVQLPGIAWTAMVEKLSSVDFIRKIDLSNRNLWAYLFYNWKLKQYLAVLWSSSGEQDVFIKPDSKNAELFNMFGNPEKLTRLKDKLILKLGESPFYLEKVGKDIVSAGELFSCDIDKTIHVKKTGILKIKFSNLFEMPLKGVVEFKISGKLEAEKTKIDISLPPGGKKEFAIKLLPIESTSGPVEVKIDFDAPETGKLSRLCYTEIEAAPLKVKKLSGHLKIDASSRDWPDNSSILSIKDDKQVTRGYPITFDPVHKDPDRYWQGPGDLSAEVKMAWDENNLYLFVDVTDTDRRILKMFGGFITATDGFELYLDGRDSESRGSPYVIPDGVRHIFVSPGTENDPGVKIRIKGSGGKQFAGIIQADSKETANGYCIEIKIPITKRFFPQLKMEKERVIGFNLQLNDADCLENPKSVMTWNGKTQCNLKPANFGKIILTE